MQYKDIQINKIVHDAFQIKWKNLVIYIDPFTNDGQIDYSKYEKADYIFVTHEHYDHCDIEAIELLKKDGTIIVGNELVIEKCRVSREQSILVKFQIMTPNQSVNFELFRVETVPAYNINKFRSPGVPFHPKENNGVGYILTFGDIRIFHTGDTDNIPEYKGISNIDILCVPVSGTYVMDTVEAGELTNIIKPQKVIPMHWGAIVGSMEDVEKFKGLVKGSVAT